MENLSNFDAINFIHGACCQLHILNNYYLNKKKEEQRLNWWRQSLENSHFEYELIQNKAFLVVRRSNQKNVRSSKKGLTYMCMFCGSQHRHGLADGHRAPHCNQVTTILLPVIKHKDGTILYQDDGYIVRSDSD